MALNTPQVDYLDCARTLTKTIKQWNPHASVCLITDQTHANDPLYDHYRVIENIDCNNLYANDWQVFFQTPYRETIKLEADMMIASSIDHWWTMFRHRDVVISTGCRTWQDQASGARHYRKVFDANNLPDVYNAITYWRLCQTARDFFVLVRDIFANWAEFKKLIRFPEDVPSTDLVYAMAADIIGRELVTMSFTTYPRIVHMKQAHAGTKTQQWTNELVWEMNPMRIQTQAQWGAFHYHVKDWHHDS
jgi:hypothetical protein